jgi:hypothetical protein
MSRSTGVFVASDALNKISALTLLLIAEGSPEG